MPVENGEPNRSSDPKQSKSGPLQIFLKFVCLKKYIFKYSRRMVGRLRRAGGGGGGDVKFHGH